MNVDDLRAFYKADTDNELAKKISRAKSTVSGWRENGIPLRTQAYFQAVTNGEVVAQIEPYAEVSDAD